MSLGVNGAFGFLLYDAINKGREVKDFGFTTAYLWGFVASSFYFGNIYGAYSSALKYNKKVDEDFINEIEKEARGSEAGEEFDF
jgi:hypothetical protein